MVKLTKSLLNKKRVFGRPKKISPMLENKLRAELEVVEGFSSYNEVQTW